MNWLNYHHLLYFKHVVEEGSIAKASKILKIGQPAISMQIKSLEDQLGHPLFERSHKKLTLTEFGQITYDYAVDIFKLGKEMMNTIQDQSYHHIKIQIGIQSNLPKNLISILTTYIYKHFNAVISVYNGTQEELTLGVIDHHYDIVIINTPPIIKDKSILYSKRILQAPVVIAGSKEFLHLKNAPIEKFKGVPFILPATSDPIRPPVENYFNRQGIQINMVGEAEDTIVQKNMAIAGNGIIPIMKPAITNYVKTKQLFVLKQIPDVFDEVWLVSAKRKIENPIANKLIQEFGY